MPGIIDHILSRSEFVREPPVLVDVGASGQLHKEWRRIAKYSICIAFDADVREMRYVESKSSLYRKLYIYKGIVADQPVVDAEFYLTKSPYCSSVLAPLNQKLENWAFCDLFEVKEKVFLKAVNLLSVFSELKINQVDWFKTDSQGMDLRLFLSLGDTIIKKVLAAEFEPGIIDAYKSEDKFWSLMSYMEKSGFWMSDIRVCGSQRMARAIAKNFYNFEKNVFPYC